MSEAKVIIEVKKGLADVMVKTEGVEVIIVDKDDEITLTYATDEVVTEGE